MAERGILAPGERLELIGGELFQKPVMKPPHASAVDRIVELFFRQFLGRASVRPQSAVALGELDEPEPDVALLRYDPTGYAMAHPGPADIHLLVEVGDASRGFDRRVKLPLYARAGVPEVWLVDVADELVTVHRDPRDGEYRAPRIARSGERIACEAFPDDALPVDAMLRSL
jgi:Uma2 family endonuclease